MKKINTMEIYEPAMCCTTGLCGVGVNPELLRIATTLQNLKDNGIEVMRYNLSSAPAAFIQNAQVAQEVNISGVDSLPLIVVNGKIVLKKKYPTSEEIARLLDIPIECVNAKRSTDCGDCNCDGNNCCK